MYKNVVKTWLIKNFAKRVTPPPSQEVQFYDKEILILPQIFPHVINAEALCTVLHLVHLSSAE